MKGFLGRASLATCDAFAPPASSVPAELDLSHSGVRAASMFRKLWPHRAAVLLAAATLSSCGGGDQNEVIWAAGSSTVFPFVTRAAENFARKTGARAPRVEALGTGGGFKAFCSGVGGSTPDIANASRPMKASEFDLCQANGVTDIVELKLGFDGIVIATAHDGADISFELRDLYLGLAQQTPTPSGIGPNPNETWNEVRDALPVQRIQVYGPPPTSGTRDAWTELAIVPGAKAVPEIAALEDSDPDRFESVSEVLRQDGGWIDAGENDNAILQTLTRTPGALGVFGFSFLQANRERVKPAKVNGVAPSIEVISDGSYPLSRSLFVYVKKAHVPIKPALGRFVTELTSDAAAGRGGYMQDRGLIPLPAAEHEAQKQAARALTPMARPAS